jgi:hypothetical protein
MKTIMRLTLWILTICVINYAQAQNNKSLPINCNTDFWTITVDGYIQQWSLSNGTISCGDTILSGGGTSLSYCGNINAPVFFSNSYSQVGITYFDASSGWINIPTYSVVNNNGGHLNDQYFMVEGAVIQVVKYWDGVDLMTVDSLNGEFFAGTQDIAVDTLGQAWVFTGSTPGMVDSLKVYNQYGRIDAYSIQFNEIAYGSFFLNDTLYLGTMQNSIYPVIISGNTAQLGIPIPFPSNSFTDMASCQETGSTTTISEFSNARITLWPNPTTGYLRLSHAIESSGISVYNSRGQLIKLKLNGQMLDLSQQASGMYFIKINNDGLPFSHKVMKL